MYHAEFIALILIQSLISKLYGAKKTMNDALRKELIAMVEKDSEMRQRLADSGELATNEYHPLMREIHEENNQRIKEVVSEYGWPGISLVGKEGVHAAWFLVQHAVLEPEFQEQCVALLKDAVEVREAKGVYLAMLNDRVLIRQGKPQIYGSQHEVDEHGKLYPLTIEDPVIVDRLRREVGLESLAERTLFLQEDYDRIQQNTANRNQPESY